VVRIPDTLKLRLPFAGSETVERNFSQAGQDLFVLSVLDGKRNGVFVDLGCNQPILLNNTFLLERQFGWKGLAVDVDESVFDLFVFRECQTLAADGTRLDWDLVVEQLGTAKIDYLSLDLEPPTTTLEGLKNIPFDRVEFEAVTFEHDAYRSGDEIRDESRAIFESNGYVRLCSDVILEGFGQFEDWYYNPRYVDAARSKALAAGSTSWENIIFDGR
jgi:hypothetical protein